MFSNSNFQKFSDRYLAGYRGGSTLTGEVFNRNPNVLYYFEPMALFGELDLPNEKIEFLNNTFHCKAPKFDTYSKLRKNIYYDYDLLLL